MGGRKPPPAAQWRSLAVTGGVTVLVVVCGLIAYSVYAERLKKQPALIDEPPSVSPRQVELIDKAEPEHLTPYSGRDFGMRSGFRPRVMVTGPFEPVAAHIFTTETRAFALDGIEGPPPTAICLGDGKRLWACGLQSRAALIGLIRDKEPDCQLISGKPANKPRDPGTGLWTCVVNGEDMALKLVEGGWARPTTRSDSAVIAALERAREARRGLWEGEWNIVRVPPPEQ